MRLICCMALLLLFVPSANAGEADVRELSDAYEVSVTVRQTAHGASRTRRLALDLAQDKLMTWLQTKNLAWPDDIRQEDRSFFLDLYRRGVATRGAFGQSDLLRSEQDGAASRFTFRISKNGIRIPQPQWPEVFSGVVNLTRQPGKVSVLTHLELAERYPREIPHQPVVQRIKSEIGVRFLQFITGADVAYAGNAGALESIPGNTLQLAKALADQPYNTDLSFLLIGKLRGTALRAVLCRITNQAQRGSKLSPAYPPIRDFGADACGASASIFEDGVSDGQIEDMRDDISDAKLPTRGFAYDVAMSFGELPVILQERAASSDEKACRASGLQACFQAFNARPSVDLASQLSEMSAEAGYDFLATAFAWQVWLWNGRRDEMPKAFSWSYPDAKAG